MSRLLTIYCDGRDDGRYVDGAELKRLKLAEKPEPDISIEACRRLHSEPRRTIGVVDAMGSVQAAKSADYGLVIGVNRNNQA